MCPVPRPIAIATPPQIAGLPQDSRGYYVPAEAPWTTTGPRLADIDPHRTAALGFLRACTVCGFVLAEGQTVWRNLSQKDAAHARGFNRQLDVDPGMAGHLSCMIYSAFACPYWASSAGRLGKNSKIEPGARRGTRPSILGFGDIWMLVSEDDSRPFLGGPGTGATNALFGYVELVGDLAFRDPQDLVGDYETALAADLNNIDLKASRAHWTNSPTDERRMTEILGAGVRAMRATPPVQAVSYNGDHRVAFGLPLT
jgi:hypothetical protein